MKSIKFNDSEIEFLITHYEQELVEVENYLSDLKNLLKKLGAKEKKSVEPAAATAEPKTKKTGKGKPGRPPKVKTEEAPVPVVAEKKPKTKAKAGRTKTKATAKKTRQNKKTTKAPAPAIKTAPAAEEVKAE